MIDHGKPNPFRVLRARSVASAAEIVEIGRERSDLAADEGQRVLVRWAVEQLITRDDVRLAWEILEIPGAEYEVEE